MSVFELFNLPDNVIVNVLSHLDNASLVDIALISRDTYRMYQATRILRGDDPEAMRIKYNYCNYFEKHNNYRHEAEMIYANWSDGTDITEIGPEVDGSTISSITMGRMLPRMFWTITRAEYGNLFLSIGRGTGRYVCELRQFQRTHKIILINRSNNNCLSTINQPGAWTVRKKFLKTKCLLERHLILELMYQVYLDTCPLRIRTMGKIEFMYHLDRII